VCNMSANEETLAGLIGKKAIRISRGGLFDSPVPPKPADFNFDKVEGMLLGIAVGDALGITTEGMLPGRRQAVHGELKDYIPNRYVDKPIGFPSDDTQLAFWTLAQMLEDRSFVPENVAARFCRGKIFGLGASVRQFLQNSAAGMAWHECGPESAGNGALMRIAPMVVPHLKSGGTGIWVDTALSAMITHNDTASISACLSFVGMLWDLLDMTVPPDPQWWLDRYVEIARGIKTGVEYRPRGGNFSDYRGSLWEFVQESTTWARARDLSTVDACNAWFSGAYLLETVPSVLYILMRHADDPEEAIVRAVNDTKDNDTIAAIVGAAVGALHGRSGIPERWIKNLSGRTTDRDDGAVFELIDAARRTFWSPDVI